ncbi:MAG: GIY-YIG nuclease family protein [Verrucomicrobiae bacterium]|nr:GIY-YIG nuclease family protein [Verrucomicrobiae bacterium]
MRRLADTPTATPIPVPDSGTSESDHPFVAKHRTLLHKIGVTSGDVKTRISNAERETTFLLAKVEVVLTFRLANIDRNGLEALLHKFFAGARLDLELKDRFGFPVAPQEWFLVPLDAIEEAVRRILDHTIEEYAYSSESAKLVKR